MPGRQNLFQGILEAPSPRNKPHGYLSNVHGSGDEFIRAFDALVPESLIKFDSRCTPPGFSKAHTALPVKKVSKLGNDKDTA